MLRYDFGCCVVEHIPAERLTVVRFPDGTETHACPHETDAYREWAAKAGCVDIDEYSFQHDIMHVLYGLIHCGGTSPALWGVAHGRPVSAEAGAAEEVAVQRLHRFVNHFSREPKCQS